MFRAINYFFKQGFKNIWNNRLISLASAGIVATSLLLFGVFLLLQMNLDSVLYQLQNQCEINVYLPANSSDEDVSRIGDELRAIDGVNQAKFLSKEERLKNVKETVYRGRESLLEDLEADNPLRDSYIVTVKDLNKSKEISEAAKKVSGVEEVTNLLDLAENIEKFSRMAKRMGMLLMLIFAFAAMFIISNTIRVGVFARSREIKVMRMVGASGGYVCGPFFVEGVMLGIFGAILAAALILWGYNAAGQTISAVIPSEMVRIIPMAEAALPIAVSFLGIGAGIGVIGSIFSVRRYLK